jgi:hypothetical protein
MIGGAGADTFTSQGVGGHEAKGGSGIDTFNHTSTSSLAVQDLGTGGNDIFTVANTAGILTATVTANYTAPASVNNAAAVTQAVINGTGFDINMSNVITGTSGFTINGTATAASLTGSGKNDAIVGGTSAESITGGAGNDALTGGGGADTINGDAGTDTIVQTLEGTAAVITTVQNFDAGTAATTVDTYAMATLAELDAFVGSNAGGTAVSDMIIGNATSLVGGALVLQVLTADAQALSATTEIVGLSTAYDDDAAALTGMATAGADTFTLTEVDNNEGILIAYITSGGDINIAVGQFSGTDTTSDGLDALSTIATLKGINTFANLGDSELIVTA